MSLAMMIRAVPATFWGIVVGSLFTVIGVVITNRSNTQRLRLQHEHERELEAKDRDLSMRRDIYLDSMDAISEGMGAVGRFGELDVPLESLMGRYESKAAGIRKVALVGTEETVRAVSVFAQEIMGSFLRLTAQRAQLEALQERIMIAQQKLDVTSADDQTAMSEARAELLAVEGEFVMAQMEVMNNSMAEVARLDELLVPVIGQMRTELGLAFDETFQRQLVQEGHEKLAAFFGEFASGMQSYYQTDESE